MKIKPEQLAADLTKGLKPLYCISGDEMLLVQENADMIREACRKQGIAEREVHDIDKSFKWDDLLLSSNSMSLFSDKKLIECRFTSSKIGDGGSKGVQSLLENLNEDNIYLFIFPKLEAAVTKSKWFKALDKTGIHIPVWPVERYQLPRWIQLRLKNNGLSATDDAVNFIADNVEGNLLAAKQEIEKLCLLTNEKHLDLDTVTSLVNNSSRYTVFNYADKCLKGDASQALKTLTGLRSEGIEPPIVLWAITRELRMLYRLLKQTDRGIPIFQALKQERVFESRQRLVQSALGRMNATKIEKLLLKCRTVDQSVKGIKSDSPWLVLEQITVAFCR